MTGKEWVALLKNWQVAMLVILLVLR